MDIFVTLGAFINAECCLLFHLWGGKFDAVIRTMHKKCQFRIATKQGSRQIALGREAINKWYSVLLDCMRHVDRDWKCCSWTAPKNRGNLQKSCSSNWCVYVSEGYPLGKLRKARRAADVSVCARVLILASFLVTSFGLGSLSVSSVLLVLPFCFSGEIQQIYYICITVGICSA